MTVEIWTLTIVAISLTVYIYIAWRSRVKDSEGFFIAGQTIPAVTNGAAIAADWISAASFISMAGTVSLLGYDGAVYLLGWTGGYVLLALLIAPYLRKFGKYTIPDFIGDRYYSNFARLVAAIAAIFIGLVYITAQMQGIGLVFSRFLQVDVSTGVTFGVVIVAFLAILGGMRGITWTQVAQYVVLIFGYLIPAIALAWILTDNLIPQLAFPFSDIIDKLNQLHRDIGFQEYTKPFANMSKLNVLLNTIVLMVGTAGLPHILIRFYTVPTVRAARYSAAWAILFIALFYTTAPSVAALARYNLVDHLHKRGIEEVQQLDWVKKWEHTKLITLEDKNNDGRIEFTPEPKTNEVSLNRDMIVLSIPEVEGLLPWVVGLVVAGGLAAALSTASPLLLVISSSVSHDIYFKLVNPRASEAKQLWVSRAMVGVTIVIAGYLGMNSFGFVAQVVAFAFGLAASSFFPALVLGIFDKRTNREGAIAGILIGLGFTALYISGVNFFHMPPWLFGIKPEGAGAIGMALNFLVTIGVSRMTPPPPPAVQDLVDELRVP